MILFCFDWIGTCSFNVIKNRNEICVIRNRNEICVIRNRNEVCVMRNGNEVCVIRNTEMRFAPVVVHGSSQRAI